ncbi:MAG: alpha-galactosidase [Spirochaetaceae bacterium]|nr:alpha-galactosidase [Spirochaetaceae bacterium]
MKGIEHRHFFRLFSIANIELRFGVKSKKIPLEVTESSQEELTYCNKWIEIKCHEQQQGESTKYGLSIRNVSTKHLQISRLRFPATKSINALLKDLDPRCISFLRNGYQSWSTARSYRVSEKPLRPRFKLVSLATSNMANLPSNTPGMLSSEMYSVIMDLNSKDTILVGQLPPFNQFFYIILNISSHGHESFFELIYDFGRQLLEPGKEKQLDGIIFIKGPRQEVEQQYFQYIRKITGFQTPEKNLTGWSSWYQYYDKITPDILYKNLKAIRERGFNFDFFQIDDGYQKTVGDWLEQKPVFQGRMKELALAIKEAGMKPGIWLAPFSVSERSDLFKMHPEFILKNQFGKKIKAGYNFFWKCHYYGLDVTHPNCGEYVKEVIETFVKNWVFEYLKCDFLFTAALRSAIHHDLSLSGASILQSGMKIIRDTAGPDTRIIGCGMPIPSGIGFVDAMRVGPDTGDFWIHYTAGLIRTGSMVGVRNSMRNFMVRSPMHKRLWLNDPDCIMIRDRGTRLKPGERLSQMDAIALSGGILIYSDDFTTLSEKAIEDISLIEKVSADCFSGQAIAIDVMEQELPEIYYNTAGYLGLFNFYGFSKTRRYNLSQLNQYLPGPLTLIDIRNGEHIDVSERTVVGNILRRGSRLFKLEKRYK